MRPSRPRKERARGNAGASLRPQPRVHVFVVGTRVVVTTRAGRIRHSRTQWLEQAISCSPRWPALSPPFCLVRVFHRQAGDRPSPAFRRQHRGARTTRLQLSASASSSDVALFTARHRTPSCGHCIPFRVRDDRDTPLSSGRDAGILRPPWEGVDKESRIYFLGRVWRHCALYSSPPFAFVIARSRRVRLANHATTKQSSKPQARRQQARTGLLRRVICSQASITLLAMTFPSE